MDLQNPRWMYLKALLFLVIGIVCAAVIWLDYPTVARAVLLLIMIWAFCRAYYFVFYVIEKYVDGQYRFSGLISFLRYLWKRKKKH
jgi:hypothetical protein